MGVRLAVAIGFGGALLAACTGHSPAGPRTLASITVTPNVSLAITDTQRFIAVGKDADGAAVAISPVWSVVAGGGVINNTGLFTAGTGPGTFANTVQATSGHVSGTAPVVVTTGPLATITVTPTPVALSITGTQQFTAVGKDAGGNVVELAPTWAVVAGGGAITNTGLFTAATGPGTFANTVQATSGHVSGTATVVVTTGPLATITVTPNQVTRSLAGTQQFTAVGQDAGGNVVAIAPTWAVVAGGGAITNTGLFTAATGPGTFANTVQATSGHVSGTATVVVTTGPLATITVTPTPVTLPIAGTQQFTAVGQDAGGNVVAIAPTWAVVAGPGTVGAVATVSGSGVVTGVAVGSATVTATSEGRSGTATLTVIRAPVASVVVSPASQSVPVGQMVQLTVTLTVAARRTYYRTNFPDGTPAPLEVYASNGGGCASSTDYVDPGSAHSIKCTIPAGAPGAAALQAWFGNGQLANLPNDPSLDQDLFEEVRFVLAPGAASAIGGTTCNGSNGNAQFKTHKSVYGQAGNAWNGWVMSEIGPCSDGNIGMFSEPEMWNLNGAANPWPGTYPSLNEGSVYDVVYRYHRYTAQGCGTIAIWVNGAKVMDSLCLIYMGPTKGAGQGLLFWDGATYLQGGVAPLVVYNLFAQATNYPIGAATPSP